MEDVEEETGDGDGSGRGFAMRGVTFLPKLIHIPAGADRVMRGDRWRGEGEPLPPCEEEETEEEEEDGTKC